MQRRQLIAICWAIASGWAVCLPAAEPVTLRVMTFNLWHGGDAGKQPLEKTVEVIRRSQADLVGLQETAGFAAEQNEPRPDRAREIAEALGWHYFDQGGRTGVISRYPVSEATPNKWGVRIQLSTAQQVYLFNCHLAHAPYQPYQLLGIPYHNGRFIKTEEEAISEARAARGAQVERMLGDLQIAQRSGLPIFLTGDFNEPSHLDWTAAAVAAGHCPIHVVWPSSVAVAKAGLADAYRAIHPDPVTRRGLTWTPITAITDPADRHDRIDHVYYSPELAKALGAQVVGEAPDYADIVLENYPSDHRAVVVEFQLTPAAGNR